MPCASDACSGAPCGRPAFWPLLRCMAWIAICPDCRRTTLTRSSYANGWRRFRESASTFRRSKPTSSSSASSRAVCPRRTFSRESPSAAFWPSAYRHSSPGSAALTPTPLRRSTPRRGRRWRHCPLQEPVKPLQRLEQLVYMCRAAARPRLVTGHCAWFRHGLSPGR